MPRRWASAAASCVMPPPPRGSQVEGPRIVVVGTGIAALMCIRSLAKLARSGGEPALRGARLVLCTSRGKLATQMGPKNQTLPQPGKPFFDYGCQYFTADEPWFAKEVQRWSSLHLCQALPDGAVGTFSGDKGFSPLLGDKCWVGNGGMAVMLDGLLEQTAREFEGIVELVRGFPDTNRAVRALARRQTGWHLTTKGGDVLGPFDYVIGGFAQHCLTDPFLTSGGEDCDPMLRCLRRVESNQMIVMQVSFEGELLPMQFAGAHVYGEEALSWIGNNSAKPQQSGKFGTLGPQHLTLISTACFGENEFNCNPKGYRRTAEAEMLAALARVLRIRDLASHRPSINRINHWEDGLPVTTPPNSRGCLFDSSVGLGWCGDFCVAPGVQGAAQSGRSMAQTLCDHIREGSRFNSDGLLPFDDTWSPIDLSDSGVTVVDIGGFSKALGLTSCSTHTDLVPSAIGGYDQTAHTGAAGRAYGKVGNSGEGSGKGKDAPWGKGRGKNSRRYGGRSHA